MTKDFEFEDIMRNDHNSRPGQARRSGRGRWVLGLAAALVALTGCDSLLDVSVPTAQTEADYYQPYNAIVLARAIAGQVECSYARFVSGNASGAADAFTQVDDDMGDAALYDEFVGGGNNCTSGGDAGYDWFEPFQTARQIGERTYDLLANEWTDEQVEESFSVQGGFGTNNDFPSKAAVQAFVALYTAIPFQIYGEYLCEVSFDGGPLVAPDDVLQIAEDYADDALDAIGDMADPDVALPYGISGTPSTGGYADFAYALRARIRWARGNLSGAAADAALVTPGFVAYVTRDASQSYRENDIYIAQIDQLYNSVAGPITSAYWNPADRSQNIGSTTVTWPDPIPFTGYLNLAIDDANGRAITDESTPGAHDQNPITTASTVVGTAVADTRVGTTLDAGTGHYLPTKYPTVSTSIPLVNWEEAWLIQAEAGSDAQAIGFVNDIRMAHSLPTVTYGPTGSAVDDMIIEERRRSLFLEGRFWATKLHNTDKLWFPRSDGNEPAPAVLPIRPDPLSWRGGVRMVMLTQEFDLNTNINLVDRNTMCPVEQRAVVNDN